MPFPYHTKVPRVSANQRKKSAAKAKAPAKAGRKKAPAKKPAAARSSGGAASAKPKAKGPQAKPKATKAASGKKKAAAKTRAPTQKHRSKHRTEAEVQPAAAAAASLRPDNTATPPLGSAPPAAHAQIPASPAPTVATTPPFPSFPPLTHEAAYPRAEEENRSDEGERAHRGSRLVPTNAVHTTRRRLRRRVGQGQVAIVLGGLGLLALLVIGSGDPPHEATPLENFSKLSRQSGLPANRSPEHTIGDPVEASPERRPALTATVAPPQQPATAGGLPQHRLVELEEMLERLDLNPSRADGVVDAQTQTAIRLYQQIAGLPIDGEPSEALLDDMREVVRILQAD